MMTTYCLSLRHFSLKLLLKLANGSTHGENICTHAYYIISMTTTYQIALAFKLLLHSSNLLTVACMDMKRCMHANCTSFPWRPCVCKQQGLLELGESLTHPPGPWTLLWWADWGQQTFSVLLMRSLPPLQRYNIYNYIVYKMSGDKQMRNPANLRKRHRDGIHEA